MHVPESTMMGSLQRLPAGNLIVPASGAGCVVRVLPKVSFSAEPVDSATEEIVIAKYVNSTMWVSGALIVRVHAVTLASGQTIDIDAKNTSYAEEEPATDFVESTGAAMANAQLVSTTVAGALLVTAFTAPIAAQLRVVVTFTQAEGGGAAMSCTIGVDLVGRPA